jgi:hypothetical protein
MALTLLALVTVILRKERAEDADNLDRVLLILFAVCFSASLIYSGVLVMAGAISGIILSEITVAVIITNSLKVAAIVFGWAKIIRHVIGGYKRG